MPGEKHPIIAHGELYVEPIVKKSRPIDKSIPHEYEDAKQRILSDISNITEKIEIQEEFFLDEKILCVRMEPKFEAKSYVPASITQVSDSISLVEHSTDSPRIVLYQLQGLECCLPVLLDSGFFTRNFLFQFKDIAL